MLQLFNIFREYDEKENCAQVLEEEVYKMFCMKYLNAEHDWNVVGMNSLNIHDANDMQSHKLGEAMFDEYDIFCPPSFDEQIYYDESMPPIYDDILMKVDLERSWLYLVMIPLFWKRFQLIMRTKLLSMMIIVMTCML